MTPLVRETMKWMFHEEVNAIDEALEMHWFDISALPKPETIDVQQLTEFRPPFEKNMVLWRGMSSKGPFDTMMIVVGTNPEEGIVISTWLGPVGKKPQSIPQLVYVIDGNQIRWGSSDENEPIDEEHANSVLSFVGAWYRSMSIGCQAYRPEVRQTFTNRRKISQGKKPSYEWRTVFIEPAKTKSESKGGTHASPRLHDRRGHLRRLRTGKNVWVRACKVGNAANGTVFHDYEVRAA